MGCASSSNPLEAAKKAAGDMMDAGEKAMSDVGDSMENTMESAVESVHNVTHSISDAIKSGKDKMMERIDDMHDHVKTIDDDDTTNELDEHIPLHTSEEMENMKNKMMNKMDSLGSEADEMADQLMKDTEMAMRDMDDEVMTIVQETNDLATRTGEDVIDAMKNEIMSNGDPNMEDDMTVEDMEGSNDSTQEITDTATPEEATELKPDTNDNGVGLPSGHGWQKSFKHFSSVVSSKIKQEANEDYKPTAWELLADSIHQSKVKTKFSKPDDEEIEKKKKELEDKTLTVEERMELAEMSDREKALCYLDKFRK